ncbi:hypothetical protein GCM10010965_32590 [Caldalkalibacillus thermarum]|uniref:hypothetical protein n=1 Tax=Caldalkalibacillus thermarum TaxID=296745 RepID=UPI0016631A35|nr:hypothetical protein [Caldalkalibacillus thermarum]GGK37240.1 hypothetical protein GCM10010965_32590 [Caldalkalibacillus thermarum]
MKKTTVLILAIVLLGIGTAFAAGYKLYVEPVTGDELDELVKSEPFEFNVESNTIEPNPEGFYQMGKFIATSAGSVTTSEMIPAFGQLDVNRFNLLVLQKKVVDGLNQEEAEKLAFEGVIQEAAFLTKARELGIEITDDEALQFVAQLRQRHELPAEEGSSKYAEQVNTKAFIEGLGITEDEYWEEFVVQSIKKDLLISELTNKVMQEVGSAQATQDLGQLYDKIVEKYKEEHKDEIEAFKKEVFNEK